MYIYVCVCVCEYEGVEVGDAFGSSVLNVPSPNIIPKPSIPI